MAKRASKTALSLFGERSGLFYATNRANVLPILSSGLVRPVAAYEKYYDDLLMHCPGQIPIWTGGFPRSLLTLLVAREPGLFPVLLELDRSKLGGGVLTTITSDLRVLGAEQGGATETSLCELVGAPIPLAAIKSLGFATPEDLSDFQARAFENLLPLPPMAVTPTTFTEGGPDPEAFKAALRNAPPSPGTAPDFRRLDSAMGGLAMLGLLLPTSKPWLEAFASAASFPAVPATGQATAPQWLASLTRLVMSPASPLQSEAGVDERLIHAALALLTASSPVEGWVEAAIANDLASRASTGATAAEAKEIAQWRDVVLAVVRSEKPAGSLDDTGSLVRRALMLLVLRCRPDRIIGASDTPLQPGPGVTAIAGMLSGVFHGYGRLPREIKEKACSPELLSRLAVCWWGSVDGVERKVAIGTSTKRDDATAARIAVTVDRGVLVERVFRPDDAMMRIYYQAKEAGFALEYQPLLNGFAHEAISAGERKRLIFIEPGRPTGRGQRTIRVRTSCRNAAGKPIRLSKREDALALLELNHDPAMQCRYAIEPSTGNVEVLVHQLVETLDSLELQSHIEAVNKTADDCEQLWAVRLATEPAKRSKAKAPAPE